MSGTKLCVTVIVWGVVVCLGVFGQSNQEIYQAIERYNSGTIDGDVFSTTILETVYRSEDPKSVTNTLKNSGVAITDQQQWKNTVIELAEYLGLLGEYRDAVDIYEYLIHHPSSDGISTTEIWGRIAVLQFVNNDVQSALASAHKALTTATNQDEIVKALLLDARFRGLSSDPQAGLAAINELIVHNPSSIHMRLLLYAKFEIQQTIGDEVGAEATQAQLLQRYPNSLEHGIVNTEVRDASIIATPLPVAIDYIYGQFHEHSSDHTHIHRPVVERSGSSNVTSSTATQTTQHNNPAVVAPANAASTEAARTSQSTANTNPITTTIDTTTQQIVVQLGAFGSKLNADKLQQRSVAIGVPARIVLIDNVYKVQVSASLGNVSEIQSKLRQANIEAYIVR